MKRLVREAYRRNRARFPSEGRLVVHIHRTDDEAAATAELYRLTARAMHTVLPARSAATSPQENPAPNQPLP